MPGEANKSLQNSKLYEKLRKKGYSKEQAAKISNAKTAGHTVQKKRKG